MSVTIRGTLDRCDRKRRCTAGDEGEDENIGYEKDREAAECRPHEWGNQGIVEEDVGGRRKRKEGSWSGKREGSFIASVSDKMVFTGRGVKWKGASGLVDGRERGKEEGVLCSGWVLEKGGVRGT